MDFETEWARCLPWIESALEAAGNTHSVDDVKEAILARRARFWAGRNAAGVTEREDYPNVSMLNIWLAGGDLAELRDELRPQVEAYAKAKGCQRVIIRGRPGWARELGYEPMYTVCGRELY